MYFPISNNHPTLGRSWLLMLGALLIAGVVLAQQGLQFSQALYQWMEDNYGSSAREKVEDLADLVRRYADADELDKLDVVNDFFNRIEYRSDADQWDRKDYWATPFEALGNDAADCEDYALSKYFTLISMGVPDERLRITYVKAIVLGEAHMVLAYYPTEDAEPLILDNLTDRIRSASARSDLVPVYSFNGTALWLSVNRVQGKKVGGSDRIKLWQAFQEKLQRQMGG